MAFIPKPYNSDGIPTTAPTTIHSVIEQFSSVAMSKGLKCGDEDLDGGAVQRLHRRLCCLGVIFKLSESIYRLTIAMLGRIARAVRE